MSSVGVRDRTTVCGDIMIYVQELNPRRTSGKRPLLLKSWSTVRDVKQALQSLLHVPIAKQRLFFQGQELGGRREEKGQEQGLLRELNKYTHSLQDCGIVRDEETIFFAIAPLASEDSNNVLRAYGQLEVPKRTGRLLKQVRRAFELGINAPKLTMEGFGGTYFMYDPRKRPLACFKPADEEPYTPNNPRGKELVANWGMVGKEAFQMRAGVKPGEGYLREVASFLMDHGGFAGVPATMVVEAKHKAFHSSIGDAPMKIGSFQEFVRHDAIVEDLSPSLFSKKQVQKIALLDLRLLNSDRNGGNILVRKRALGHSTPRSSGSGAYEYELIPIDHGYCLPETICIDDSLNLCWYEWRQVKEPMDAEVVAYINSLDAEKDCDVLRQQLGLKEAALDNLRITTLLLKLGAAAPLTLYDLAQIIVREVSDAPSELERVKSAAEELALAVWKSNHGKARPTAAGGRTGGRLPPLVVTMPVAPVTPSLSPGSDGAVTDKEMGEPQISATSSSSSLEDIERGTVVPPKEESSGSHRKKVSMSVPLKIRLDVIEREQQALSRAVSFKDSEIRPSSPPSPAGFWHEPFEEMTARAEEQRVGTGMVQEREEEKKGGLVRQTSVCAAYGSGPQLSSGVRLAPVRTPYTFEAEEVGMTLSDEEVADSNHTSPSGASEGPSGEDQFSWNYYDQDDNSSVNQTSSAASASSQSSISSSPTPDLDEGSPVGSPTGGDLSLAPRVAVAARSVSGGTGQPSKTTGPASSNSRRLTRALSSPDLKKGFMFQSFEGDDFQRSKSTFWSGRVHHRDKMVRQSKEYRQCVFHYIHLLLKDLVQRKAKQKSLAM